MTTFALKEWDAQCQLLQSGTVSLIVRKGGIREIRQGFEVKHERFLLYPTFLHENQQELQTQYHQLLRPDPQPGQIYFAAEASVEAVYRIESLKQAQKLEPLQALTAGAIERKFNYHDRPWVHALLLRVRPLRQPFSCPETTEMQGCVSWVPLPEYAAEVGRPVVEESELAERRRQIEALLG